MLYSKSAAITVQYTQDVIVDVFWARQSYLKGELITRIFCCLWVLCPFCTAVLTCGILLLITPHGAFEGPTKALSKVNTSLITQLPRERREFFHSFFFPFFFHFYFFQCFRSVGHIWECIIPAIFPLWKTAVLKVGASSQSQHLSFESKKRANSPLFREPGSTNHSLLSNSKSNLSYQRPNTTLVVSPGEQSS